MRALLYAVGLLCVVLTSAEEASNANAESNKTKKLEREEVDFDAKDHTDWGSYYDPKNEFCGKYDCYKILGFDYESFGREHPDKKEITQRYRSLSREWHPDKSKRRDAKDRFVKIARAYEVLTDDETRKEYDFMRYNQEAYFKKYGSSVMWTYAPKSDTIMVVIFLLVAGSGISWFVQKQQWQNVADKLIKAAVEDWPAGQGGTPESKEYRERALKILQEREKENGHTGAMNGGNNELKASKKKKKTVKLTASEKRKQQEDSLRPIITELVEEIDDFGAGYHKPTWRDLFVVRVAQVPVSATRAVIWNSKYAIRRMQKVELNDEEREVLTRRAVGEINWVSASKEEQKEMIKKDLWISDNMVEWEEEQEVKQWSNADRKRYQRMKKRAKAGKEE